MRSFQQKFDSRMPCTILSFHEELFSSNPPILLHEFVQFLRHPPKMRRKKVSVLIILGPMFFPRRRDGLLNGQISKTDLQFEQAGKIYYSTDS